MDAREQQDWDAVQYVLGELNSAQTQRWEKQLDQDQQARDAVVDAVELLQCIRMVDAARGGREDESAQLRTASANSNDVCAAQRAFPAQQTGPPPSAAAWSHCYCWRRYCFPARSGLHGKAHPSCRPMTNNWQLYGGRITSPWMIRFGRRSNLNLQQMTGRRPKRILTSLPLIPLRRPGSVWRFRDLCKKRTKVRVPMARSCERWGITGYGCWSQLQH